MNTFLLSLLKRMQKILLKVFAAAAILMAAACDGDAGSKDNVEWINKPASSMGGNVEHFVLDSSEMGHGVGVSVHLPTDYAATDKDYAVIYFLHGVGGNEISDIAGIISYLEPILREHQLADPIVVFPNGGMSQYQGQVEPMIINELIPQIDQRYRTIARTQARLVAGFSMGGAGAIRLSIRHPRTFAGAISWAGGMWHKDTALLEAAAKNAPVLRSNGFRALMINGEHDRANVFAALEEVFDRHSVSNQRVILAGQKHEFSSYLEKSRDLVAQHLQQWYQQIQQ